MSLNTDLGYEDRLELLADVMQRAPNLIQIQVDLLGHIQAMLDELVGKKLGSCVLPEGNLKMAFENLQNGRLDHLVQDLLAYGRYGIVRNLAIEPDQRKQIIRHTIEDYRKFLGTYPMETWELEGHDFLQGVLAMAQARWSIDHNLPVDPAGLAHISRINFRSIKNLMANGTLRAVDKHVRHEDAVAFLKKKKDFFPSIWHSDEPADDEPAIQEDYLLVPASRSGRVFHPGLNKNGLYRVGKKNQWVVIDSYDGALEILLQTPKPYWAESIPTGFSAISVHQWIRISRRELQSHQDDPKLRRAA